MSSLRKSAGPHPESRAEKEYAEIIINNKTLRCILYLYNMCILLSIIIIIIIIIMFVCLCYYILLNYYNIVLFTKFFWTVFRGPQGTAGETKTKKWSLTGLIIPIYIYTNSVEI